MREIKFRAWNARNCENQMVYFGLFDTDDNCILTAGSGKLCYAEKDTIIMQYTGLKDKNGKEIYENDIVIPDRAPYCMGLDDGEPVTVTWLECGGWYPFADNQDGMVYPDPAKSEVIGNIYEDQELRGVS